MPNKLVGIIGCLILAALVNVSLRFGIPAFDGDRQLLDGNSLMSSLNYDASCKYYNVVIDTTYRITPLNDVVCAYRTYIKQGGGDLWLEWRLLFNNEYGNILADPGPPDPVWAAQVLRVQDNSAPAKWLALFGLIVALLVLWSKRLKEYHIFTPIFYFLVALLAIYTYGALSAPLFSLVAATGILVYGLSIRLMLPLYRTEWTRSLRPLLTFWLLLLGAIAFRGPEWVDYQFWTSDLFRLILLTTAFFSLFFHWVIISKVMKNAKLELFARIFGYAVPLGTTAAALGLLLGFWGKGEEHSFVQLNRELLVLPPEWLANFSHNLPFLLFFAGFALVIIGGIGYFIQRIAR